MYEIREYDIRDKENLINLWVNVSIDEYGFTEWKNSMNQVNENDFEKILVAVCEDDIVGSMAYKKINDNTAELKRIYLYPNYRGKGIATSLYKEIMNIIKEHHYKKIIVETRERFESGIAFYYKNHFELESHENEKYIFSLNID